METNDILIIAVVVITSVTIGASLSYFIITNINFPREITMAEPIPICNPAIGQYTPGTCGIYSNMTFTQCKPINVEEDVAAYMLKEYGWMKEYGWKANGT